MPKRAELTRREVRAALAQMGKNQRWLARELGVTDSTISEILSGRYSPSLEVAIGIQRLTGVPAERFVR